MSMITEQVKRLREQAELLRGKHYITTYLDEAADTLEMLAAKVRKENGFILPENPTNGDMIKALFPDIEINKGKMKVYTAIPFGNYVGANIDAMKDWWNAPYKRGDTE